MVTDAGYALPTAVVARSIANMQTPNIGPIYFVWIDDEAPPRELIVYLDRSGINLVTAQNSLLRTMKPAYAGYVTRASAARLFLATLLDKFPIDKFLCLDGDIEVAGAL